MDFERLVLALLTGMIASAFGVGAVQGLRNRPVWMPQGESLDEPPAEVAKPYRRLMGSIYAVLALLFGAITVKLLVAAFAGV